jgi:hypothetical protein
VKVCSTTIDIVKPKKVAAKEYTSKTCRLEPKSRQKGTERTKANKPLHLPIDSIKLSTADKTHATASEAIKTVVI